MPSYLLISVLILVTWFIFLIIRYFRSIPDPEMQGAYTGIATKIVQTCFYATKKGYFPPRDGEFIFFPLNDEESRNIIKYEILKIINNNNLTVLNSEELANFILNLSLNSGESEAKIDIACTVINTILGFNLIAKDYYKFFPKYEPMFKMVDNITKICMPVMDKLFDNNLPTEIREIAPYFSRCFEDYRISTLRFKE